MPNHLSIYSTHTGNALPKELRDLFDHPICLFHSNGHQVYVAAPRRQSMNGVRGGKVAVKLPSEINSRLISSLRDGLGIEASQVQEIVSTSFLGEAKILAKLRHPSIPRLHGYSTEEPKYIAMEYIDGTRLDNCSKYIYPDILVQILSQVASAVSYLHSRNIFHGDIRGKNVMVDKNTLEAKLIDFSCSQEVKGSPAKRRFFAIDLMDFGVLFYKTLPIGYRLKPSDIFKVKFAIMNR